MRVVSGNWRGRKLKAADGVRPTTDRMKESIFSAVCSRIDIEGVRVLDLFAGSGGLGIEALSRGAKEATFVEAAAIAREIISKNLASLECEAYQLVDSEVEAYLSSEAEAFDLVFADPPYNYSNTSEFLRMLDSGGWLSPGALIVLETAENTEIERPRGLISQKDVISGESRYRIFAKKD